jgi:hypothetical protein
MGSRLQWLESGQQMSSSAVTGTALAAIEDQEDVWPPLQALDKRGEREMTDGAS